MFITRAFIKRMVAAACSALVVWSVSASTVSAAAGGAGPTIVGLSDLTNHGGGLIGPLLFTIGDDATPADALVVTATSSDQALVPDANISLGGSGATRSLGLTPIQDAFGTTTITVSVFDGTDTTTTSFVLTLVPIARRYMLAEGATGPFFDTDILIGSPYKGLIPVGVKFLKDDGTVVDLPTFPLLGPQSRTTIRVDEIPGMESTSFSTIIESPTGAELAVERTMRWDTTGYGSHTEKANDGPALQWYFAEGSQGTFFTYFLLVNPQTTANTAHVTYFREGDVPITRDYPLLPSSRRTVYAGDDLALVNTSFGARVDFDQPGMAERSMYFGTSPLFNGGTVSAGVTRPATEWFLAEGATGSFFTTFVLLANPGTQDTDATITYLPASGPPVVKNVTIAAGQRMTRNIATEDATLADAAVGVRIQSQQPIVVERSQYWPNPFPSWFEAHNSFGLTETGQRWGLAEGGVGGAQNEQTYILLANPGTVPATAQVSFLSPTPSGGGANNPVVKTFTVQPSSRFNVAVAGPGSDVPELTNQKFSAIVDSTEPIVVERSFYADANGLTWAAGSNATAGRMTTRPPVAVVSPDQVGVALSSTIALDGSASFAFVNLGSDPIQYEWTFLAKPAGSSATLTNPTTATPGFVVDVPGDYLVQLVVRQTFVKSAPETVFVSTAVPPVSVAVTAPDSTASEGAPDTGTLTFTRTGGVLTQPLTIRYSYDLAATSASPGTVGDPTADFEDFGKKSAFTVFAARTITIPANQASVSVTVQPFADNQAEPTENLRVNITPNRAYVVTGATAAIAIADGPVVP